MKTSSHLTILYFCFLGGNFPGGNYPEKISARMIKVDDDGNKVALRNLRYFDLFDSVENVQMRRSVNNSTIENCTRY